MLRRRGQGGLDETNEHLIDDDQKQYRKHGKQQEFIGFRHWIYFVVTIAIVYAGVVALHRRMPPVRDASSFDDFSEQRARVLLKQLTALGPRPSGSVNLEEKAFGMIQERIEKVRAVVDDLSVNRIESDVQRPSGCFDLKFLSSFTLCYHKITNIVVRVGPKKGPSGNSLLLNCHFDTMPDTPGATDDAVACTILMEVLEVLAHSKTELQNDVVFLFNGAEENFLQAAHGFIKEHPWRHDIRAFINLEGTGSGGREILFQAGPGNSWILQTYLENAPHPFCSVLAQEVFQSGIIPSDTDFRIFRDYGRISGLDIAYTKNGWFYHTEFDEEWRIEAGAIQRAGENVLAVVRAILASPYLEKPASFDEQNRWVFYDVVGLFTVYYTVNFGKFLNYMTCFASFVLVFYRIQKKMYTVGEVFVAFKHHAVAVAAMITTMLVIIAFVVQFDLVMCWYKMPEIVGPLYVLPMLIAGAIVHSHYAQKSASRRNVEMVQYDTILIILASVLFVLTSLNLSSAFYVLNNLLLPISKDVIICGLGAVGIVKRVTPRVLFFTQLFCFIPTFIFAAYAISQCVDFFVPVMGRSEAPRKSNECTNKALSRCSNDAAKTWIVVRVFVRMADSSCEKYQYEEGEQGEHNSDNVVHAAGDVEEIVDEEDETGGDDEADWAHDEFWIDCIPESE
uniref:FXNA-like protease n=1 Tax=Caenorhabditis japonica TaxID=281687 RepID=A0A8R1DSV2_CAEJA